MVIVLNLQTDNTIRLEYQSSPTYLHHIHIQIYIFLSQFMLQYDVNPALAATQSISILHKTFGFMTLYVRTPMPQNTTNPTHYSRKGLWPDLQDAMTVAF